MLREFFNSVNYELESAKKEASSALSSLKEKKQMRLGNYIITIEKRVAKGGYSNIYLVKKTSSCQQDDGSQINAILK